MKKLSIASAMCLAGALGWANAQTPVITGAVTTFAVAQGDPKPTVTQNPNGTTTTVVKKGDTTTSTTTDKQGKKVSEKTESPNKTTETTYDQNGKVSRTRTEETKPDGTKVTTETKNHQHREQVEKRTTVTEKPDGSRSTKTEEFKEPTSKKNSDDERKTKESTSEKNADGSEKYKETEYKDGKKTKESEYEKDKDGNVKRTETEFDKNGNPVKKTITEVDKDGKKTVTETDGDGKPIRKVETEKKEDGSTKETETKYDKDGKKTSETETETDKSGKRKVITERKYWPNGKLKSKQTTTKEGGSTSKSDLEEWDETGAPKQAPPPKEKKIRNFNTSADLQGVVLAMPTEVAAGQPVELSAVTLSGEVIANAEVTLDGGPNGKTTVKTDNDGKAVVTVPSNWNRVRAVLGTLAAVAIVRPWNSAPKPPKIMTPPQVVTPGQPIHLPVEGIGNDPTAPTVLIGGVEAPVLACSPHEIVVLTPADIDPGQTSVIVKANGQESPEAQIDVVRLEWGPGPSTVTIGAKFTRNLIVNGTRKPTEILLTDPDGDAARANRSGALMSTGGDTNIVPVEIVATSPGGWNMSAVIASADDAANRDVRNAEAARRDAAGWRESARTDTDKARKDQKNRAAGQAEKAAQNWDKASAARKEGKASKADALEKAAELREKAANAWGSSGDSAEAKRAEEAAKAQEAKAR